MISDRNQKLSDALARFETDIEDGLILSVDIQRFLSAVREWDVARRASEAGEKQAGAEPSGDGLPAADERMEQAYDSGGPGGPAQRPEGVRSSPAPPAEPAPPTAAPADSFPTVQKADSQSVTVTPRVSPERVEMLLAGDWRGFAGPDECIDVIRDLRDARAQLAEADAQFLRTVAGYKRRKEAAEAQLAEAQRENAEFRKSWGTFPDRYALAERAEAAERREQALREQCAKWAEWKSINGTHLQAEMRAASSEARK